MVYESDFYTTHRRPYSAYSSRPNITSYSISTYRPGRYHPHLIPRIAHKRLCQYTTPVPHNSVRRSVLTGELDRILYRPRAMISYDPMEDFLNEKAVTSFEDVTRAIRARTASLLKSIHTPVPRSIRPLTISNQYNHIETPISERISSDEYIWHLLRPLPGKYPSSGYDVSYCPESATIPLGTTHLACVSFAGDHAIPRRHYIMGSGDDHRNVRSDVELLSHYNRARKAAANEPYLNGHRRDRSEGRRENHSTIAHNTQHEPHTEKTRKENVETEEGLVKRKGLKKKSSKDVSMDEVSERETLKQQRLVEAEEESKREEERGLAEEKAREEAENRKRIMEEEERRRRQEEEEEEERKRLEDEEQLRLEEEELKKFEEEERAKSEKKKKRKQEEEERRRREEEEEELRRLEAEEAELRRQEEELEEARQREEEETRKREERRRQREAEEELKRLEAEEEELRKQEAKMEELRKREVRQSDEEVEVKDEEEVENVETASKRSVKDSFDETALTEEQKMLEEKLIEEYNREKEARAEEERLAREAEEDFEGKGELAEDVLREKLECLKAEREAASDSEEEPAIAETLIEKESVEAEDFTFYKETRVERKFSARLEEAEEGTVKMEDDDEKTENNTEDISDGEPDLEPVVDEPPSECNGNDKEGGTTEEETEEEEE